MDLKRKLFNRPRKLLVGLLTLALILPSGTAFSDAPKPGKTKKPKKRVLSLKSLIKAAVTGNPILRKLRYAALSFKERVPQVGAFPDPMVTLALVNLPLDSRYTPMTGVQVGFMQMFPFFGKRKLREKVARSRYFSARHRVEEAKNRLVAQVKLSYHRLQFVVQALDLLTKYRKTLVELVRFAQAKYGVGMGHQADVIKAQVALSRIVDRIISMQSNRALLKARLNSLCARSPISPMADPPAPVVSTSRAKYKQLAAWMDQNNPLMKSIREKQHQFQSALKLAKRAYYPDFRLGVSYRFRTKHNNDPVKGADFLGFSVGFNLPVFTGSKLDPRVRQMRAKINQSKSELADTRNRITLRINQLRIKMSTAERQIALYERTLIPQARQAVGAAKLGYQSNKIDFLTVLNNQTLVFRLEIRLEKLKADYGRFRAALEWLVGRDLP